MMELEFGIRFINMDIQEQFCVEFDLSAQSFELAELDEASINDSEIEEKSNCEMLLLWIDRIASLLKNTGVQLKASADDRISILRHNISKAEKEIANLLETLKSIQMK